MDRRSPQEIESLVLGYEELDEQERAEADGYLQQDPALAERLRWHQNLENEAEGSLPGLQEAGDGLSPEQERAQQESLRRVLRRAVPNVASPAAWRRPALWALPLAAVLALTLLWPRDRAGDDLLRELRVVPVALEGDTRGFEQVAGVLRSGQAFALEFSLENDAHVTIFHLDPSGHFAQVHPDPQEAAAVALTAGAHRVPSADSESLWVLNGEPGPETFFIAVSAEAPKARFTLAHDPSGADREARVADLAAHLRERFDEVEVREFLHAD
jgi:hypothetical protein